LRERKEKRETIPTSGSSGKEEKKTHFISDSCKSVFQSTLKAILWDFGNEALYLLPQSQKNLWIKGLVAKYMFCPYTGKNSESPKQGVFGLNTVNH
jgi:hypothetical protein